MDTEPMLFLVVTPRDHSLPSRQTIAMPAHEAYALAHVLRGCAHILYVRVLAHG